MTGDNRTRVAFCIDQFGVGGSELNALRTAEALDPRRVALHVFHFAADGPLLASLVTSAALIPVLLLAQTRLKHHPPIAQADEVIGAAAALTDPGAV